MQKIRTIYRGRRIAGRCIVQVVQNGVCIGRLDPRLDLRNHSPTGFEWGYGGSGPAQLAFALCAALIPCLDRVEELYHAVKWELIAGLPRDRWELTPEEILACAFRKVMTREERLQGE